MECDACGAEVLDIDVKCGACGRHLTSTGAHSIIGEVVLGTYELVDILGQGGMSVVYKARHKLTEQEVALKILPPELALHSQVKSRFLEEARALAALDHPNIVHLYNFGQEGNSFVLAMQLVRGITFERMILEAEQLHWGLAAGICIDVLRALEYAHSRGVIHRDMKPSNVLVREDDGSATVMDFGIAKMTTSTKLTATGQTMGTVRYMSPEQVRGKEVDVGTDIYSLGASLYEAVVGDTPFEGETHFEIMTKHLSEPPVPPSARGVKIPVAMERALMRSLAKAPGERFASARDFRDALESVLESGDLGEADTLRMTRELVASLPKGRSATATMGSHGGVRPGSAESATAERKPAAGSPAPAVAGPSAGTRASASSEPGTDFDEHTGVVVAGRHRPAIWIALAGLVAVASAAVAIVVLTGGVSKEKSPEVEGPPPSAPAPSLGEPFRFPGVSYAVEEVFSDQELRVMAVEPVDVASVRQQHKTAVERFGAFLRERGYSKAIPVQPLSVQLVPPQFMCRDTLYSDNPARKSCDNEAWYRAKERTLVLPAGANQEKSLVVNVAFAMCLQLRTSLCDAKLLEDFERRISSPETSPGKKTRRKPKKRGGR